MKRIINDQKLNERFDRFVAKLQDEAQRRVRRRKLIEARWLQDLRQYHGQYEPKIQRRLNDPNNPRSSLFINQTRPKTNAMAARLMDLLFPTDDKNWGIRPTPVPELSKALEDHAENLQKAQEKGEETQDIEAAIDELRSIRLEAKKRASLMEDEINDQLKACNYQAQCRDMIEDACKIGTGVIKGPVVGESIRKRWLMNELGEPEMVDMPDRNLAFYHVDPWSFFPDPDCRDPNDGEGVLERHLYSAKDLRKLARRDDMDKDAIRRLLTAGPKIGDIPYYVSELTNITGESTSDIANRYHVWEYRGPVAADDLKILAEAYNDDGLIEDTNDVDPLDEINVTVWFCDTEVLSFAIHPLDSGETIYSVFTLEKDEAGPFGYGIPYLMRDDQSATNSAWRMMLDNAGISAGPQIVIDKKLIEPQDGDWTLRPFKIWEKNGSETSGTRAFQSFDMNMRQVELANIVNMARLNMDESTGMPKLAQGEQGTGVTKTAQGMALLMNSANVVFRRIVRNFDDDVTTPNIRRAYDWNMQFNKKQAIKGDYDIDARGSSVLLVREMQATNLMTIALQFGAHPIYGPMTRHAEIYRAVVKAHGVSVDEVVKSEREIQEEQAKAAQVPDPTAQEQAAMADLKKQEIQSRIQVANIEAETRRYVAKMAYEEAMNKLAEQMNMSRDALDAKLAESAAQRHSAERKMAVEVSMAQQTGKSSGGAI